ncbi:succinate dehydrogenase, hydrophobic membrane anchor protein [Qingshengfaniella alkalisoli]|uniref:Succinate dehydrogenase hydrophobic membrane anchor subunit n=1 Tax=Qingshengfaniella alkalisoli TaxID=2599296 RepID=A0A5B8I565_9RHOB|nr:succinate dehydrogenase, hydrophobic membrane anchor protein [Qingshengfaniella alkalisoli]QDY68399.1 succinate dehydrogenase, hydrophobic membrane anchor protein [Qingshengfaniella alkalisoli]
MRYLTDRKRATGLGSAKSGTEHFWNMTLSSIGLLVLVPLFIFTFGPQLGAPYEEVVAYFARPFPAIVAGLTLTVGMLHFKNGAQVAIEDYVGGLTRKIAIAVTVCLSYALIGAGLYALVRLAL